MKLGQVFVLSLLLSLSLNAFSATAFQAQVETAKAVGSFTTGIGSTVTLQGDVQVAGTAIFLGKAMMPSGDNSYEIFFSQQDQKVYYIQGSNFDSVSTTQWQTIENPYEQSGGTCTGYAIYDFLAQTHLAGVKGNGELDKTLSTEEGRTNLLVDNINQYYLTPQHKYSIQGILNGYGKTYGFACHSYTETTYTKLHDRIMTQLSAGLPVLISFNIGPNMYNTPFPLEMYGATPTTMDNRVWIPRKTGERNSGGHSILFVGSFEVNQKTYLVTVDSDWSEPRIWDMDSFLNDKTVLSELSITTCK